MVQSLSPDVLGDVWRRVGEHDLRLIVCLADTVASIGESWDLRDFAFLWDL